MSITNNIKESILLLKSIGEHELASDLLCALAAIDNGIEPRADLTYTTVMRELRKSHKDQVSEFEKSFKAAFDSALDENLEDPERVALLQALQHIDVEL